MDSVTTGIPPVSTRLPRDGCDVVTAGLAVVVAVDLAAQRVGHERGVDDQLLRLRQVERAPGRERHLVVRGSVDRRGRRHGRAKLGCRRLFVLALPRGLDRDDRRELVGVGIVSGAGVGCARRAARFQ